MKNFLFCRVSVKEQIPLKKPNQICTVPDSIVIIPTYNEKEEYWRLLNKCSRWAWFSCAHYWDGSPDGTAQIENG